MGYNQITKEIIDFLYKGQSIGRNLLASIVPLIVFIMLAIAYFGLKTKTYEGYFEIVVVGLLMLIVILQLIQMSIHHLGWGQAGYTLALVLGIELVIIGSFGWLSMIVMYTICFLFFGHIIYILYHRFKRNTKSNTGTIHSDDLITREIIREVIWKIAMYEGGHILHYNEWVDDNWDWLKDIAKTGKREKFK